MKALAWIILSALLIPAIAMGGTVTIPNTFSSGTTASASQVNANFTAVSDSINASANDIANLQSMYVYADPSTGGTTTGGIAEALTLCGSGVSGASPSNGCTVMLACGDITVSTSVTLGGNSTATAKDGVRIVGCGSGSVNSNGATNPSTGGTTIKSTVAGPTFQIQGCRDCGIYHVGMNGTNASTIAVDLIASAGTNPSSHFTLFDVEMQRYTSFAVRTNATTQVDQLTLDKVIMRDTGGCLQQQYSQNVLTVARDSECANPKSTGGKVMWDIQAGSFLHDNSFTGTSSTVTGLTLFSLGTSAAQFTIDHSHIEMNTTGNTMIDDNTAAGSGHSFGGNAIRNSKVLVAAASNVCFDVATRGSWTVDNVEINQTTACSSTFNMSNATDIANGDQLFYQQTGVVNNINGVATTRFNPTLGSGVIKTNHETIARGNGTSVNSASLTTTTCANVDVTATGALTTDRVIWNPDGPIDGVTGFTAATTGGVSIQAYAVANAVRFRFCNPTTGTIDPGAITVNWSVVR